ncbi:MAG: saccharopine dehydrogenase NADP-binding domain-containing protein [Pseudomonadota bacterium]
MNGALPHPLLIYGANGYTAKLLLAELQRAGVPAVIAGRNESEISQTAALLNLPSRVFSLDQPQAVDRALAGVKLVLNAAGPFSQTARPLIEACLRARVDYLDLSGELGSLGYAAECGEMARRCGVMLLPAVGFDVVPSDCLALHLAEQLPDAESLELSIAASNLLSRGSAATFVEHAGSWVQVRRAGQLEPMRFRTQMRWVDFGSGERPTIAVSWGDLVTAYHSTGIRDIEVYFEATAFRWSAVTANQLCGPVLGGPASRALLEAAVKLLPSGPRETARARERSVIVGQVTKGRERRRARLTTPEAYTFTAQVASRVIRAVLNGLRQPGFRTPAQLLGADFVLGMPGVVREELA